MRAIIEDRTHLTNGCKLKTNIRSLLVSPDNRFYRLDLGTLSGITLSAEENHASAPLGEVILQQSQFI